jgi:hypothetical protein
LLLELNIGIAECAADQALEVADRVLEVGGLLCLSGFTNVSAFGAKSDEGTDRKETKLVSGKNS